jgi:hypothetical protein
MNQNAPKERLRTIEPWRDAGPTWQEFVYSRGGTLLPRPLSQYVYANLLLFIAYSLIGLILTWADVRMPRHIQNSPLNLLGVIYVLSAVPVACLVNWTLTFPCKPWRRLVIGITLGVIAVSLACIPFCALMIEFRVQFGGTL